MTSVSSCRQCRQFPNSGWRQNSSVISKHVANVANVANLLKVPMEGEGIALGDPDVQNRSFSLHGYLQIPGDIGDMATSHETIEEFCRQPFFQTGDIGDTCSRWP